MKSVKVTCETREIKAEWKRELADDLSAFHYGYESPQEKLKRERREKRELREKKIKRIFNE